MFQWLVAFTVAVLAGVAGMLLARRERALHKWLSDELAALREDVGHARVEAKPEPCDEADDVLDSVEGEELEIATNLDRMNVLLDRLNGLLQGQRGDPADRRRIVFREEQFPMAGGLDFTSPEEVRKFCNLPPLSEEEISSIDWEHLFSRLQSDDMA